MKVYLKLLKNSMNTATAFKSSILFFLVFRLITLFATISIWHALYGNKQDVTTNSGNVTLNNVISFIIISTGMGIIIKNTVIRTLHRRIITGEIAMDLIKPISVKKNFFLNTIGNNIVQLFFQIIPFVILSKFFFNLEFPNFQNLLFFIISLINAIIINFMLQYTVGLLGFWYESINPLDRILNDTISFFSGLIVPLWFFPDILHSINNFLPFKYIYFLPINIYLNKMNSLEAVYVIITQYFWIFILIFIEKILWNMGIKKLAIQGG